MRVAELWRYPVKSLQGERLTSAELTPRGLAGDRAWALFDLGTGLGLTARRRPELLHAAARVREDGGVEITLPDGSTARDDDALSAWLGRPVALRAAADVTTARRYENPDDIETEAEDSWWVFEGLAHGFHDSSVVTLLSTATVGGRPVRRFRPNVVLDIGAGGAGGPGGADGSGSDGSVTGGAGGGEDALVGTTVRIGDAAVAVTQQVPRCVMVTRAQPGGIEVDRDVLRWIHRQRSGLLAVGGRVLRAGTVRVGDEVGTDPGA